MHKKFLRTFAIAVVCLGALGPIGIMSACGMTEDGFPPEEFSPETQRRLATPTQPDANDERKDVEFDQFGQKRIACGKKFIREKTDCTCCVSRDRINCGSRLETIYGGYTLPWLCAECKAKVDKGVLPGDPPVYSNWRDDLYKTREITLSEDQDDTRESNNFTFCVMM